MILCNLCNLCNTIPHLYYHSDICNKGDTSPKTTTLHKYNLFQLRTKQPFRVSQGKSQWFMYEYPHNYHKTTENKPPLQLINLREILDDEIVIEFDMPKKFKGGIKKFRQDISLPATKTTSQNLIKDNINFDIWEHLGKSPHIHIHNLPIKQLNKEERKIWKETFIFLYTPKAYHKFIDTSLCGCHLIALEWANHWKKIYSTKKLIFSFK